MRIKGAKKVHYDSGPNMTPLVDVVMVILIFLMLAGSFGGAEHFLLSKTPITKGGVGAASDSKLVVPDDVQLYIEVSSPSPDRFVARVGDISTGDTDKLVAALAGQLRKYVAAGKKVEDIQVLVRPARTCKYEYTIAVYQAALSAEFTKVSFAHSQ